MRTYDFVMKINGTYSKQFSEEEIDEMSEGEDWRSWSIEELAKSLSLYFRNWKLEDIDDFLEECELTVDSCNITEKDEE